MQGMNERRSTEMPKEAWGNIDNLAERIGATAERGPNSGKPSWRTLLRMIAEDEKLIDVISDYYNTQNPPSINEQTKQTAQMARKLSEQLSCFAEVLNGER